jgi:uncharacterized OsmC-like protein
LTGETVGFREIRLAFELEGEASEEEVATLIRLTERYCVVFQTLAGGVPVAVSVDRADGARPATAVDADS